MVQDIALAIYVSKECHSTQVFLKAVSISNDSIASLLRVDRFVHQPLIVWVHLQSRCNWIESGQLLKKI